MICTGSIKIHRIKYKTATGEKKGPTALSFPPRSFTLPEYNTARARHAQCCRIYIYFFKRQDILQNLCYNLVRGIIRDKPKTIYEILKVCILYLFLSVHTVIIDSLTVHLYWLNG